MSQIIYEQSQGYKKIAEYDLQTWILLNEHKILTVSHGVPPHRIINFVADNLWRFSPNCATLLTPYYSHIRERTVLTFPSGQTDIRTLLYGNLVLRLPEN